MDTTKNLQDIFGETIHTYTRKQAIEDGVLADISQLAGEAGFKYPVALSSGVASLCEKGDFTGRAWDILTMLRYAAKKATGSRCDFTVKIGRKNERMYSLCHGGDNGEPVITIMLPHED